MLELEFLFFFVLGHGVKRRHSQESVEALAKQKVVDLLLRLIWVEVR